MTKLVTIGLACCSALAVSDAQATSPQACQPQSYLSPDVVYNGAAPGGNIIQNPQVVLVVWSTSVSQYIQQILPNYLDSIAGSAATALQEYNAVSRSPAEYIAPGQLLYNASTAGGYPISPSNNGTNLTVAQVEQELVHQIAIAALPAPTSNMIYMINFPPGVQVQISSSTATCNACPAGGCQYTAACGWHHTTTYNGTTVRYALIPDFQNAGCEFYCSLK